SPPSRCPPPARTRRDEVVESHDATPRKGPRRVAAVGRTSLPTARSFLSPTTGLCVAGQGLPVVGVLRRDQLLGTGRLPLMTRVTTTLGECGLAIPCCWGPRTNR